MTSREDQVREEARLAESLVSATQSERAQMYGHVYDRIYEMHLSRLPDVLDFGASPLQIPMLTRLTEPGDHVLEFGCGGGFLAIELARRGRRVTGVDVSKIALERARDRAEDQPRLTLEHVAGLDLPYPDQSFDFLYSVEVLEHLHEDDGRAHLVEALRVLRPGGRYWISTPNRLHSTGAAARFGAKVHADADVHLKEWTYGELRQALTEAGFIELRSPVRAHRSRIPLFPISFFALAERLPRRPFADLGIIGRLEVIGCSVIARRPPRAG